jgi:hypothetical protein
MMRSVTLLLLLACFAGTAQAGDDGVKPIHRHHWPSMYPRLHYWTPTAYRLKAYCQPIGPYILPVNTTPCVAPTYKVDSYRMPPVDPAKQPYYPNLGVPLDAVVVPAEQPLPRRVQP